MNWRPKDWRNPHPGIYLPTNDFIYSEHDLHREFEAGADTILEALKKRGRHMKKGEHSDNIFEVAGWLVFIPMD